MDLQNEIDREKVKVKQPQVWHIKDGVGAFNSQEKCDGLWKNKIVETTKKQGPTRKLP